jgi:hypothetical protein
VTHPNDEVFRRLDELVEAYEQAMLVYAQIRPRYRGMRPQDYGPDEVETLKELAVVALGWKLKLAEVTKGLFALSAKGKPAPDYTDEQWFRVGIKVGRDLVRRRDGGELFDLGRLRPDTWM